MLKKVKPILANAHLQYKRYSLFKYEKLRTNQQIFSCLVQVHKIEKFYYSLYFQ